MLYNESKACVCVYACLETILYCWLNMQLICNEMLDSMCVVIRSIDLKTNVPKSKIAMFDNERETNNCKLNSKKT